MTIWVPKTAGTKVSPAELKFRRLVSVWAKKIHAEPSRIRFQKMTKKWASCSTAGQITFNAALLYSPHRFQEAVILSFAEIMDTLAEPIFERDKERGARITWVM